MDLFAEIFPLVQDATPFISVYHIKPAPDVPMGDFARVITRLGGRFRKQFGGIWLSSAPYLLTDEGRSSAELAIALQMLQSEADDWRMIASLTDADTPPTPTQTAEMVLRGKIRAHHDAMQKALNTFNDQFKNITAERDFRLKAYAIHQDPAISISIASRLIYAPPIRQFVQSAGDNDALNEKLVGLWVTNADSTLRGEISGVVGRLKDHRERLSALAVDDQTRDFVANTPDDDPIIKVRFGQEEVEYLGGMLRLLVRLPHLSRFDIDPRKATHALQLPPDKRAQQVRAVSDILKNEGIISNAYSTRNTPDAFFSANFEMNLRFADNRVRPYAPQSLRYDFANCGAYKLKKQFAKAPIRVCVVNTLSFKVEDFVEAMQRQLKRSFPFTIEVIKERQVRVITQKNLESAVKVIEKENPDVILAFFPDDLAQGDDDDAESSTPADSLQAMTLGRGFPTHLITETMLNDPEMMPLIIMGILGKTGNAPFVLTEPLESADFVIGLDVVRDTRKHPENPKKMQTHLTAIARIYKADGEFVRYTIRQITQDEPQVPYVLLRDLFPQRDFKEKRVVIHHDGALGEDILQALRGWGTAIKAQFYPTEILRTGTPRLYALGAKGVIKPEWGSAFKFNAHEAMVITNVPDENITPQPLYVRTLDVGAGALPIEEALRGVLVWSLLAYGMVEMSKQPVTILKATQLAYWLRKGGAFHAQEGEAPFWL
ncbi:MAG: hypothetical protein MUE54_01985 [Anaerolineae bacterium]|jgi:hypothetical protein|nr:hypothetical protein [Anaerolineae bacterium]